MKKQYIKPIVELFAVEAYGQLLEHTGEVTWEEGGMGKQQTLFDDDDFNPAVTAPQKSLWDDEDLEQETNH